MRRYLTNHLQEKGSSPGNEDHVNPENATEHPETRNESAIEHVKKPYDQGDMIPITEGGGKSPRKKRPWDSEEEKENTMTFKRIRFEAIPEEAQNNWEVPDQMVKYDKKYFEKHVSDEEPKDSITLDSPVRTNLPKAKTMDDYFVELLKNQNKIAVDDTFKKLQTKILTIMGSLSKVWYTVVETLVGCSKKFDVYDMLQYIDQTVLLIGQAFNSVFYSRHIDRSGKRKGEGQEHSKKPGFSSRRGIQRTFWQIISEAQGSYI